MKTKNEAVIGYNAHQKVKDARVALAQETLAILEQGHYIAPSGKQVDVKALMKISMDETRTITGKFPSIYFDRPNPTIEVTNESTFAAIQRLYRGAERGYHVACLNFASARTPGGGVLSGAVAQEEDLCISSGLYPCLLSQPEFYRENRACGTSLYLDKAITSLQVPFIRGDDRVLLEEPVLATVITIPAPNERAVRNGEPSRIKELEQATIDRVEFMLDVANELGVTDLVLGAWGCGVFGHDPVKMAGYMGKFLLKNGKHSKSFKRVVFAVFDPTMQGPNYTAFKEILG